MYLYTRYVYMKDMYTHNILIFIQNTFKKTLLQPLSHSLDTFWSQQYASHESYRKIKVFNKVTVS